MSAFAKLASDWESRLEAQRAQLGTVIPSTEEETARKALAKLQLLRQKAYELGYTLRSQLQKNPLQELLSSTGETSIPTREIAISVPAVKQAVLDVVTDPLLNGLQAARIELSRMADAKISAGRRVTDDPATLPWYYPSAVVQAPKAFGEGYQKADKDQHDAINADLDAQIAKARQEFEKALQDEYSGAHKSASAQAETAGELIDGLAQLHVKTAAGELNNAAGVYLALATILGQGAYQQSKRWTEEHDPRVMQAKAVKELIKQRMRLHPPALRVGSEDDAVLTLPPSENAVELTPSAV